MSNEGSNAEVEDGDHDEVEKLRVTVSLVSEEKECIRQAKCVMHRQHDEERKQKGEPDPMRLNEGSCGHTASGLPANDAGQWRAAADNQKETETLSARSLEQAG